MGDDSIRAVVAIRDEFFEAHARAHPEDASTLGLREHAGRLGDAMPMRMRFLGVADGVAFSRSYLRRMLSVGGWAVPWSSPCASRASASRGGAGSRAASRRISRRV